MSTEPVSGCRLIVCGSSRMRLLRTVARICIENLHRGRLRMHCYGWQVIGSVEVNLPQDEVARC